MMCVMVRASGRGGVAAAARVRDQPPSSPRVVLPRVQLPELTAAAKHRTIAKLKRGKNRALFRNDNLEDENEDLSKYFIQLYLQ